MTVDPSPVPAVLVFVGILIVGASMSPAPARSLHPTEAAPTEKPGRQDRGGLTASRPGAAKARLFAGSALAAFTLGPVAAGVVLVGVVVLRRARQLRLTARIRRAREEAVPELIDLVLVLVDAGRTPTQTIRQIADRPPPVLAEAMSAVIGLLDLGVGLADSLLVLIEAAGEPARAFVDTITRAEIYGDPLGPLLVRLHDESIRQRRHLADISARQLPIRLCFPLVCCTLPAFGLLTIVPLLAGAFSSLRLASP